MEFGSPIMLVMLACWGMLLLCLIVGALVYHYPELIGIDRRRGFDVLPPPKRAAR